MTKEADFTSRVQSCQSSAGGEGVVEAPARLPVARIIDDNQPGATAIVAIVCDPPTLGVGTLLYSRPRDHAAELVEAYCAGQRDASLTPPKAEAETASEPERNDYITDAQARELFGLEDDDEELPEGRVRVCAGEWVKIPGGYYFDTSAGLLHPETASERERLVEASDARRYRYLRENHVRRWKSNIGTADTLSIDFDGVGHDLDAAIDADLSIEAALAQEPAR